MFSQFIGALHVTVLIFDGLVREPLHRRITSKLLLCVYVAVQPFEARTGWTSVELSVFATAQASTCNVKHVSHVIDVEVAQQTTQDVALLGNTKQLRGANLTPGPGPLRVFVLEPHGYGCSSRVLFRLRVVQVEELGVVLERVHVVTGVLAVATQTGVLLALHDIEWLE